MRKLHDGDRFGRWTVISGYDRQDPDKALVRCDCGTEREVDRYSVTSGKSRSCGCLQGELVAELGRKQIKRQIQAGDQFGRWTVKDASDRSAVAVICACGTEGVVRAGNLVHEHSQSCGCLSIDRLSERRWAHGSGYEDYRYRLWHVIRAKCYRPTHRDYRYYGSRGITVWEPWRQDFIRFRDDLDRLLGPRPDGMTLDRWPDNDGNYEPGNIRWATREQQAQNRRSRWRQKE